MPASRCSQALFAKGELTDRRPARAFPAGCRDRQRPRSRMRSRRTCPRRSADHRARIAPRSTATRSARSRKGEFAWTSPAGADLALYALERAARSDADARVRRHGSNGATALPAGRRASTATRASRITPRASCCRAANAWYREVGACAADAGPAGVARARGAARSALARRARRDRAAARTRPAGAAWRYWKARALAATGETAAADVLYATLAAEVELLRPARRRGARARRGAAGAAEERPADRRRRSARRLRRAAGACAACSSSRSSTCGRSRSANGSTSCAGWTTTRCCWPPSTRAGYGLYDRAINTAERTVARHDYALALHDAVPRANSPLRRAIRASTKRCSTASRGRSRASSPTSCRRRARWA